MLYLVRHAESTANAGEKTTLMDTHLTIRGRIASEAFSPPMVPQVIATTKYIRTLESAMPTMRRFPKAKHIITDLHEFTYLSNPECVPSTVEERKERVDAYWERADPHYVDGPDVESFAMFMNRVASEIFILKMTEVPTIVFTHGLVIKAFLWMSCNGKFTNGCAWSSEDMKSYCKFNEMLKIDNLQVVDAS